MCHLHGKPSTVWRSLEASKVISSVYNQNSFLV